MTGSMILALVAHPDDESLIAGGTLALAARAGVETAVISLTRGELGPIADVSLASSATLGQVREEELRRAAEILGISWVRCLPLPDGELPWVEPPAVLDALAGLIGARVPEAILTFGEDGLYGHPDHTAARNFAHGLASRLGGSEVYEAAWPTGTLVTLAAAMRDRGLPDDLWGLDPAAFGCDRDPTVTINVRPVLPAKLAALRAHRTQLAFDHLLSAVPLDLAERHLGSEAWTGPAGGRLPELLGHG